MPKFFKLIITLVVLGGLLLISQQVSAQSWIPVRGGIPFGISGMALINQQSNKLDFLIVHDNKKPNQGRLAIISLRGKNQPEYLPLNLPNNIQLPTDLEALTSIPDTNNFDFIAVNSEGKAYYLQLESNSKNISIFKEFNLPKITITKNSNFESFCLQKIDNQLIAMWGHRGEGVNPAKIYWGKFDLNQYQITNVGEANFQVPFHGGNVRHISDIKIDHAGIVYITSASDGGDNGPFESAVYVAGYLGLNGNKIEWKQNPNLFPIYRDKYHKIEGLELIPGAAGGIIVGTDDENMGSSVYMIGE
ncbi:hypothetical protein A0J48_016435 [Sphaerospermopsis aphanizomenoides BCCUSP55]|uniref:hypothetical protein n=1 Tax=Sphaerospermopsis aphanizomenoides TaxID=459663 RepID=UPI0019067535|nr:hypothetical protein [Sphaerospermopsis aphanizomenoides]MBK1989106.1 hypothetical protein [Sphaerospermopsis aphanizomenoides BCCUSP55]